MIGLRDRQQGAASWLPHARRPIFPGAELESNRVDIGVFVDNGANPSAPGFVTFCSLDSEGRTYDDKGRIREIGYGAGEVVTIGKDVTSVKIGDRIGGCFHPRWFGGPIQPDYLTDRLGANLDGMLAEQMPP